MPKKTLFQEESETANSRGDIHKTVPIIGKDIPKEEKKSTEDDDDDWGAVPAFLRRSKK